MSDFSNMTPAEKAELVDLVIAQMAAINKVPFKPIDMDNLEHLDETGDWPAQIVQLMPGNAVSAGAPDPVNNKGTINWPLQDLAKRTAWLKAQIITAMNEAAPVGSLLIWLGDAPPAEYLELAGTTHNRASYAALWTHAQASGMYDPTGTETSMFGPGDGATTFTLPDLRGEFLRGWDHGRGVDAGRLLGSFQDHAFETHRHGIYDIGNIGTQLDTTSGGARGTNAEFRETGDPVDVNDENETRPRNVALMFCIKY